MENKTHGKAKNTKLEHNGQVYKKPTVLTKTVPYLRVGTDKNKKYEKYCLKTNLKLRNKGGD